MTDQTGPQLKLTLANDKTAMHLAIADKGAIRAGIVLSAEQLDQTIAALVQIRADLKPEIATVFPEANPPGDLKTTHYHFGIEPEFGRLVLSLRNPGLGWLRLRFDGKLLERMLGLIRAARASDTKH